MAKTKPKTGKQIVQDMMQERIVFGGMLFTRFGLLKELKERGYTAEFIDVAVFAPGNFYQQDLSSTTNEVNEVPVEFWEDDAPNLLAGYYMRKDVQ